MHIHKWSMGPSQETYLAGLLWGGIKAWIFGCCLRGNGNLSKKKKKKELYIGLIFFFLNFLLLKCNTPIDEKLYVPVNTLTAKPCEYLNWVGNPWEAKQLSKVSKKFIKLHLSTLYNLLTLASGRYGTRLN